MSGITFISMIILLL